MKKLNVLIVLVTIILMSCSSDDDMPQVNELDIIGTWIADDLSINNTALISADGFTFETNSIAIAYASDYNLTFNTSNSYVSVGSYDLENTITAFGETVVENMLDYEFIENGTWTQVGTDLTVTFDGESGTFAITNLTDTNLSIVLNQTESFTEEGESYTITTEIIATFTRQ